MNEKEWAIFSEYYFANGLFKKLPDFSLVSDSHEQTKKEKKEDTMSDNIIYERRYLKDRAWSIYQKKLGEARVKFGLDDLESPQTVKEMKELLSKGLYVVKGSYDNNEQYPYIRWIDPNVTPDDDSYVKFKNELKNYLTTVEDVICILTPAEALKKVQELDNYPV